MDTINNNLWGQDIALDENNNPKIAINGEFILTNGVETGLQDIKLRLFTYLGSLFYDTSFGSLIYDWILEENTLANRMGLISEIIHRVEKDARVKTGSVRATIQKWDEKNLSISIYFSFIGETHSMNLILSIDKSTKEMVVYDSNAREDSLTTYI